MEAVLAEFGGSGELVGSGELGGVDGSEEEIFNTGNSVIPKPD
jgi:hypothetical protein